MSMMCAMTELVAVFLPMVSTNALSILSTLSGSPCRYCRLNSRCRNRRCATPVAELASQRNRRLGRVDVHEAALGGLQPDLLALDAGVLERLRRSPAGHPPVLTSAALQTDGDVQRAVGDEMISEIGDDRFNDLIGNLA